MSAVGTLVASRVTSEVKKDPDALLLTLRVRLQSFEIVVMFEQLYFRKFRMSPFLHRAG